MHRRDEENLRSRKCLDPTSYEKVREVFEQLMVSEHLSAINDEITVMIQQKSCQDLLHAFALLKVTG